MKQMQKSSVVQCIVYNEIFYKQETVPHSNSQKLLLDWQSWFDVDRGWGRNIIWKHVNPHVKRTLEV